MARRSRGVGLLEPPSLLEVQFAGDASLVRLSQPVLLESYSPLRRDLRALMVAGFLARLFLAALPDGQPDEGVFDLLTGLMGGLSSGYSPVGCGLWGQDRLLCELGLAPDFEACLKCGSPEVSGFSALDGGVLCSSCYGGHGFALSSSVLESCRALRSVDLEQASGCLSAEVSVMSRVYKEQFLAHLGLSEALFRRVLPPKEGG